MQYMGSLLKLSAGLTAASLALAACSSEPSSNEEQSANGDTDVAASEQATTSAADIEQLNARVIDTVPLPDDAFVQGLEVDGNGDLLLGTGQYGDSGLYRFTPGEETTSQSVDMDPEFFGEGITQHEGSIWQLTWKAGTAVRYDAETFEETARADYDGEGWGLCSLGDKLALSDGTSNLRFVNPDTFDEVSAPVEVTMAGDPVDNINELECVDGEVYANVWMDESIIRIDPDTGAITALINTGDIDKSAYTDPNDVLNGIAHIPGTDEFWITGKRWDDIYKVSFE